jgi:C4-dicarboxylate transporter
MVTTIVMAVHHPIFLEAGVFVGLAWVVTATPRAVPLPPLSGDQRLAVGIRPLEGAPPCPVPSQKPAALLQ